MLPLFLLFCLYRHLISVSHHWEGSQDQELSVACQSMKEIFLSHPLPFQASFYEFAMEAATEGIRQGHFHTLTGDLFSYPVELVECRNKGQALCGDKLTVSVWESGERPKQIFCQIHKDDTLIWIGTLSFGTPAKL